MKGLRKAILASVSAIALVNAGGAAHAREASAAGEDNQKINWNMPAQPLAGALIAWSERADYIVLFQAELAADAQAPALIGSYDKFDALSRLLKTSGLSYGLKNERTLVVTPSIEKASFSVPTSSPSQRYAEPERLDARDGEIPPAGGSGKSGARKDEVVVTGTRLRGTPPAAPVQTVTREDILQSGYNEVGDVMRSLPSNFSGGANPGHLGGGAANQNIAGGSTVNLRGLGDGATLVLLNGHRLAADTLNQSADISGIPLAAVERIELVMDGSSAVYGSDAVAGVVNFILRRDYEGAEFSARLGGATQGGGFSQTYSGLGGLSSDKGRILISGEYTRKNPILASQRDFTADAPPNVPLSHALEKTSVFASAGYELTDRISLESDGLWSNRSTSYLQQTRLSKSPSSTIADTRTYSVNAALKADLGEDWALRGSFSAAQNWNETTTFSATRITPFLYQNSLKYAEAIFDGPVSLLPSGDIRIAAGGGWREESFKAESAPSYLTEGAHHSFYAFGETRIPLVEPSPARTGLNALELSASGRFEHYSDYGNTSIPKVGFRYVPADGITVRGSWGKSFKTPSFQQYASARSVLVYPAASLGGGAGATALYWTGGSTDLRPERSSSWTIGADYNAPDFHDLAFSATYFSVRYSDRVVMPISAPSAALSDPAYAPFVIADPSAALQADIIAGAGIFVNLSGAPYDPDSVAAIADNRQTNASSQTAHGIDFSYRQTFDLGGGSLHPFASATWIRIDQQTLPTVPEAQLSATIFNVPAFRARGGLTWELENLTATTLVNYQTGSTDTGVIPHQDISSWLTIDATITYRAPAQAGIFKGAELSLSASNLFDRDPPFAQSPALLAHDGIYFDSVNASAVGRFISATFRKAF
ncbi:MAG: TonB-dependent receptor [Parvularculaceae bacterium]